MVRAEQGEFQSSLRSREDVVAGPWLPLPGPTVSRVSEVCRSAAMQGAPGLWQKGQAPVPLASLSG